MTGPVTVQQHPAPAVASRPDRPPGSAWRDAPILAAATGTVPRPGHRPAGPGGDHGRGTRHPRPRLPGPAGRGLVVNRIRKIFTKLGIGSRRELEVALAHRGQDGQPA